MSIEEASASVFKVFYELPEHWASTAMMEHAMGRGARPHNPMTLGLKKSLRAHRKIIDELPNVEHVAYLPTLVQTNPRTWTKHSTRALASARAPAQARLLEFAATQEGRAVSTASTPIVL